MRISSAGTRFRFLPSSPHELVQALQTLTTTTPTHPHTMKTHLTAQDILRRALAEMESRAATHDPDGKNGAGERSMTNAVDRFNDTENDGCAPMTEEQGWRFMQHLKRARLDTAPDHVDSAVDLVAYVALEMECRLNLAGVRVDEKKDGQGRPAVVIQRKTADKSAEPALQAQPVVSPFQVADAPGTSSAFPPTPPVAESVAGVEPTRLSKILAKAGVGAAADKP